MINKIIGLYIRSRSHTNTHAQTHTLTEDNKNDNNYRPFTIISVLAKLLEMCLYTKLYVVIVA